METLIKREIGFPTLHSPVSFCSSRAVQGFTTTHFAKETTLLVKWTKKGSAWIAQSGRMDGPASLWSPAESVTSSILSALQDITNGSSTPLTSCTTPRGGQPLRSPLHPYHPTGWPPTREEHNSRPGQKKFCNSNVNQGMHCQWRLRKNNKQDVNTQGIKKKKDGEGKEKHFNGWAAKVASNSYLASFDKPDGVSSFHLEMASAE